VFNTYNLNILFTIASLPSKVSMMAPPPMDPNVGPQKIMNHSI
jgi:hypothetical protein